MMRTVFVVLVLTLTWAGPLWGSQWYRGNLHMHSLWSDGNVFPEDAVTWYRDNGYQFVCLSDHQILQLDTNMWLEVGSKRLSHAQADPYMKGHPASVEVRRADGKTFIRLKTLWELKRMLDQPETFVMIPGHELNQVVGGLQIHMNAINVHDTIPFRYGETALETFRRVATAVGAWGDEQQVPTLFMVNHPAWPYFDIKPEVLIGLPEVRFFEVCNADGGNTSAAHPSWYTLEKFWDVVNAFRIGDGYDPVFGVGSDDTHNYTDPKGGARPGESWICVWAANLSPEAIVQSMYRGGFYASTGVALRQITFDEASGTLRVSIEPIPGETYTVRFVSTRSGFDRTVSTFDDPAKEKKPARTGVIYSDSIGKTVKTVDGTEASYTMAADELYVRAVVTSTRRAVNRVNNEPECDTAWTQPVGWRSWQKRNPLKAHLTPAR